MPFGDSRGVDLFAADCRVGDAGEDRPSAFVGTSLRRRRPFYVRLIAEGGLSVGNPHPVGLEAGEGLRDGVWRSAGGGDVDGLAISLQYADVPVKVVEPTNTIWLDLMAHGDSDTARRLRLDPSIRRDPRKLTIQMNAEGTRGFSVTMDQLLQNKTFWIPSLDVYLAVGDAPAPFSKHQKALEGFRGNRVLDRIEREPEASYADYKSRWEDLGSPGFVHPGTIPPGHIICVTWDSAIPKFGIHRGAGVWNDMGNPDHFRFEFDFGRIGPELKKTWKGQQLLDGLPIVATTIEKDGIRYEIEQFACPLHGPPPERRGDIPMVLMQRVQAVNLDAKPRTVALKMAHRPHSTRRTSSPWLPRLAQRASGSNGAIRTACLWRSKGRGRPTGRWRRGWRSPPETGPSLQPRNCLGRRPTSASRW